MKEIENHKKLGNWGGVVAGVRSLIPTPLSFIRTRCRNPYYIIFLWAYALSLQFYKNMILYI